MSSARSSESEPPGAGRASRLRIPAELQGPAGQGGRCGRGKGRHGGHLLRLHSRRPPPRGGPGRMAAAAAFDFLPGHVPGGAGRRQAGMAASGHRARPGRPPPRLRRGARRVRHQGQPPLQMAEFQGENFIPGSKCLSLLRRISGSSSMRSPDTVYPCCALGRGARGIP